MAGQLGPLFLPLVVVYGVAPDPPGAGAADRRSLLALRLFKSNRDAGLILLAALVAGAWGAGQAWFGLAL